MRNYSYGNGVDTAAVQKKRLDHFKSYKQKLFPKTDLKDLRPLEKITPQGIEILRKKIKADKQE